MRVSYNPYCSFLFVSAPQIARPENWKPLFSSWLQELVDLDLFNDAPIKISVRPEGGGKEIPCTFRTFGEVLDALNNLDEVAQKCPGLAGLNTPFSFRFSIKGPQMSVSGIPLASTAQ